LDSSTLERLSNKARHFIRELRKWNLAPLGAVLVGALLFAGAFGFVLTARDDQPDMKRMVRAYYETRGGGAPSDKAMLIDVSGCVPLDAENAGHTIYRCTVSFDNEAFAACFTFEHGRVAAGSVELGDQDASGLRLGCQYVAWNSNSKSLDIP
jgi:hypothetical protein